MELGIHHLGHRERKKANLGAAILDIDRRRLGGVVNPADCCRAIVLSIEPYHQILRATRSLFIVYRAGIDIGAETKRHAIRRGGCPRPHLRLNLAVKLSMAWPLSKSGIVMPVCSLVVLSVKTAQFCRLIREVGC